MGSWSTVGVLDGYPMTLPPRITDWPPLARFEYEEALAIKAEQRGEDPCNPSEATKRLAEWLAQPLRDL